MSTSPTPARSGPAPGGKASTNGHGGAPALGRTGPGAGPSGAQGGPVTRLRAGRVEANSGRVGRVFAAVGLVTLVVLAVVLFVSGAQKNAQIAELRTKGVAVEITVTGCLGELAGSGSNVAGYSCTGTYVVDGHRYQGNIPGNAFYPSGRRIRGVSVPSDPLLISTPRLVAAEHQSAKVFILPSVLLLLALALGALLLVRLRRAGAHPAGPGASPGP